MKKMETTLTKGDKFWGFSSLERLSDLEPSTETKPDNRTKYPCVRCGGTGKYKGVRLHQPRSDCFTCKGKGYFLTSADSRKKAKVARIKRKEKELSDNWSDFMHCNKEIAEHIFANAFPSEQSKKMPNSFFRSLYDSARKHGDLTEKQTQAVYNSIAREADYLDKKKEEAKPKAVIDLSGIREPLTTAKENKLVKPVLRAVDEESDKVFIFTLAKPNSANPNFVYVKEDGEYAGKISPEGEFFGWRTPKESVDALVRVSENISEATIKYARKTGKCGCCGRGLTVKESILAGVGPVCADKFGIEYGE
tara:strand:- start:235 stop:1155 length:921 start_codon:yes stop_codon:yes gene_type:complete